MISEASHSSRRLTLPCADRPLPLWKRSLDIAGCLLALPFVAIVAAFLYVWLALTSPGEMLFRQERIGRNGRRFMLYKFRTMHLNADVASHRAHFAELIRDNRPMQKLDATRDCRLIPGGWLLRTSGLDELAQIVNILKGEMSLVGPRPCIPYEYEQYTPWHCSRLNGTPGLTGLWQVSGKNRTTFDEMVRLDIQYNVAKSLWLDLAIIAKTIPALCVQILDTREIRRRRKEAPPTAPVTESGAATYQA